MRNILFALLAVFIALNVVAAFHAYTFTHFTDATKKRTNDPKDLRFSEKIHTLFFGISNPKPTGIQVPARPYKSIILQSNEKIACWHITVPESNGTIIIFHGYASQKAAMLTRAEALLQSGYNVLLADFMGSGGSEGNQTTIGFYESENVKTCYEFIKGLGEKHIYLFGTSMGAVAILKAIDRFDISPSGIVLECPFGNMYKTTKARFDIMNVPSFPMASLLVFWGGIENNFWAFGHNPTRYAKNVDCPTLLLYGKHDPKVSREEIDEIYNNLSGVKQLKVYPNAGHEDLSEQPEWLRDITRFLSSI